MTIAIFTEGTTLMHKNATGRGRDEIIQQVINCDSSVKNYAAYAPIANAASKIRKWAEQGGQIVYMTSRKEQKEVSQIQNVLDRYNFPKGQLEYRKIDEGYKDVAERIMPDILIEDDCETVGREKEMTYPHIEPGKKEKIKTIIVKEFDGIDFLPDNIELLRQ